MTRDINELTGKKKILVIRVSSMDAIDPIDAVRKVIEQHGYSWFGKYGRPVSPRCFSKIASEIVYIAHRKGSQYDLAAFRRAAVQTFTPKDGIYPQYYRSVLSRISTWIKLLDTDAPPLSTDDLIISSTRSALSNAFRNSLSSHFLCELRGDSNYDLFR